MVLVGRPGALKRLEVNLKNVTQDTTILNNNLVHPCATCSFIIVESSVAYPIPPNRGVLGKGGGGG